MLPKITELEFDIEQLPEDLPPIGKSFLYDFNQGDFVLKDGKLVELHGIESLKMWIEKTMRTERYRFRIYDNTEYGIILEELIGMNLPRAFIEAEIEREVTESLTSSLYIDSLESWSFERDGKWMRIFFRVNSPMYNTFDMEVIM
ncbi:DUF2634 domain-containing protein [Sporosarcina sp. FSL K6-1522]|uniref:DUF2634 domain-containing protein n=1 Tax=Sporosarcina sp. FSL K6-1522 TaxID=2921554 RepID=UPI00315A03AB